MRLPTLPLFFCDPIRRNARGIGAIADFLSLVFAWQQVGASQLLLHEQGAMPADDFRNRRLLHAKPILSGIARWSPQAVNAHSFDGERPSLCPALARRRQESPGRAGPENSWEFAGLPGSPLPGY